MRAVCVVPFADAMRASFVVESCELQAARRHKTISRSSWESDRQ